MVLEVIWFLNLILTPISAVAMLVFVFSDLKHLHIMERLSMTLISAGLVLYIIGWSTQSGGAGGFLLLGVNTLIVYELWVKSKKDILGGKDHAKRTL